MPTSIASKATDSLTELYARSLCRESGERFVRVVRDRILKETVYEANGERFRVKGLKTAAPVRELALDAADTRLLRIVERMVDGEQPSPRRDLESDAKVLCRLWARLLALAPANFPRVSNVLKLGALKTPEEVFADTEADDLAETVRAGSGVQGPGGGAPMDQGHRRREAPRRQRVRGYALDDLRQDRQRPQGRFRFVDISAAGLHER